MLAIFRQGPFFETCRARPGRCPSIVVALFQQAFFQKGQPIPVDFFRKRGWEPTGTSPAKLRQKLTPFAQGRRRDRPPPFFEGFHSWKGVVKNIISLNLSFPRPSARASVQAVIDFAQPKATGSKIPFSAPSLPPNRPILFRKKGRWKNAELPAKEFFSGIRNCLILRCLSPTAANS